MNAFFDSSAFAKRYVEETGSDAVQELCAQVDVLALSVLCVPEIVSALNRSVRERRITAQQYATVKRRLLEDVRDAVVVNLTPGVVAAAVALLEAHPLRAADALQVACAQQWKAELFVSADERQRGAARESGLKTRAV
ncbi:MAG: type II toxin-antitoxin system VapC family toxin [Planctomycetota bacterium]|nr:type II toxin-antitoxin system VapC family toxin [Planctomycetota bacterium]